MTKFSDNPSPSLLMAEHVDPSNPSAGYQRLFVDTDHILKMVDSSGTVTTFGTGLADPMTTRGDIIVRNASNATARLAIGSSGKVLSSDGTDISWQTPSGGGALALLSSNVLGSAAADITVTGISGSYKDLILVIRARSTTSSDIQQLRMRVGNGSIDTGSSYSYYKTYNGSIGNGADSNTNDTTCLIGGTTGATSPAGTFSQYRVEVLGYASATQYKTWVQQGYQMGTGSLYQQGAGVWKNTAAAIDQVRVYADSGNLDTGSSLHIYGRG